MANTLQLKVFVTGRVSVETEGAVIDEAQLGGRQARLVFAYLVAERGRPVPRDELAEALWGETPPVTRDKALTVIASKLRTALADAGLDGRELLTAAFGCYRLDLPEGTWVDLFAAASSAKIAEQALAADDLDQARSAAESAESLTSRPFLPGEEGTWADQKRRDLIDIRERALSVLADVCLRSGDAREAARWADELIELSPFHETGYRRLMEAHVAAGNRAAALQVYEQCRQLLAEELGAYPSPETEAIYRELLASPAPGNGAVTDDAQRLKEIDRPESVNQVEAVPTAPPPPREGMPERSPAVRRRTLLAAALAGVIAAAVAVPVFALSSSGSSAPAGDTLSGNDVGAVSASTGHIFGSAPLAGSPDAITAGDGSIWAAMPDRGIVSRIDTTTNTVQQTIRTPGPGGPSALTFGGGFIWVANTFANTVSRIDPRANGGRLVGNPIHVGNNPTGIAYGLHAVWVANSVDRTVTRINPVTGTPDPPISVEDGADDVAAGDRSVWVIGRSTGVLSRIDPTARTVVGTTPVEDPTAVAIGPDAVWVASGASGTVSKIDPSTGHLEAAFPVGGRPSGIAVARDGHVWVANAGAASLTELDPATGRKVRTVHTGAAPGSMVLAGDTAYVAAQVPPSAHRGGTLTLAIANNPGQYALPIPEELDPAGPCPTPPQPAKTACGYAGLSAGELLTLTNDGLLGYSQAGGADTYKVVADLATSVPTPSDGGLTYTFQLRKGIHYSTGGVVQPADIRRGIERALLDSKGGQGLGAYLAVIVGADGCLTGKHCDLKHGIATSPGSSAVTFHLIRPDPDFLLQLALPNYDAVPASTPLRAHLPLPATGPYEIASWQPKGVVVLKRNPRFRVWSTEAQPDGYPDKIVERYRFTGAQAIHAVEQGTADITTDGLDQRWPPDLAASLQTRYSSQLYPEPQLTILGLWLNTRVAPFNDIRVRQALNVAVNRIRLAQINAGEVACQFLPPGVDGYRAYCPYNGPDLTKARKLVAESGTKGQPVTVWSFKFPKGTPQIGLRNGRYFVSVLRSLGYDARLKLVPHNPGVFTWQPGRQAGIQGWGGNLPSPSDILSNFVCTAYTNNPKTNSNFAELCDRHVDAQIARARALETTNPTAAAGAWHTADRMLTDDAPWVPIKVFISSDFVSRRVGNYKYCWLSAASGLTGACLDQVWVR